MIPYTGIRAKPLVYQIFRAVKLMHEGIKINATNNFNTGAIIVTAKKGTPCSKTGHTRYSQTHKLLCFTMFFNQPDTPKVLLPMRHLHPHVIHVLWAHLTQHSKLHLDWFSHFRTAHGRKSLYFTMCIKMQFKCDFK